MFVCNTTVKKKQKTQSVSNEIRKSTDDGEAVDRPPVVHPHPDHRLRRIRWIRRQHGRHSLRRARARALAGVYVDVDGHVDGAAAAGSLGLGRRHTDERITMDPAISRGLSRIERGGRNLIVPAHCSTAQESREPA